MNTPPWASLHTSDVMIARDRLGRGGATDSIKLLFVKKKKQNAYIFWLFFYFYFQMHTLTSFAIFINFSTVDVPTCR